jgi:pseudouridine-5'-phosphate glycosidase
MLGPVLLAGNSQALPGRGWLMQKRIRDGLIDLSPEVAKALSDGRAVVALESTIITHGMPFPENVETAKMVEATVRDAGGVPATVAVIGGRIKVGLSGHQLERLGDAKGVIKATRRDLSAAIVKRADAGTTVAATMAIAARASIEIFATGGIGGVHRGAEQTFDISADLTELAKSPVAVVCAGCKSILDIAKTLEFLETHGVPVVGYQTDEFPAFFARSSGSRLDHRFDDPAGIAAMIRMERKLGSRSGVLVANPVPEEHALPAAEIEDCIAAAVKQAERAGIGQKEVTPYLLKRINELTGGKSLAANIALIKNNARVAAEIAVALAELPVDA